MATKTNATKDPDFIPETDDGAGIPYDPVNGLNIQGDFNSDDEWKPTPLIPSSIYHGNVTNVAFNNENQCVIFDVTLQDNGGVMSDGSTPIDGNVLSYKVWLPRPGDENEMTKTGKQTKRQAKINMMKQFADQMKIRMSTPKDIITGISTSEWIGLSVRAGIGIREWKEKGITLNEINSIVAG